MSGHSDNIHQEVRGYVLVFVALAALTVVTVAVKYLHLKTQEAIIVALAIATLKGSLVACYFMHLISEKKLIYTVLLFTGIFLIGLVVLLLLGYHDTQTGVGFVS